MCCFLGQIGIQQCSYILEEQLRWWIGDELDSCESIELRGCVVVDRDGGGVGSQVVLR